MAIVNRKGGSGKTTTAVNLSAALALRGEDVLLVDMDPQANASIHVGVDIGKVKTTVYELLLGMEGDVEKAVIKTKVKNLDLLPSAVRLSGAEVELADVSGRETLLKKIVEQVDIRYTYIIFDCPVSFGILALNVLIACDEALVPVQTHHFSVIAIDQLVDIVHRVNKEFNKDLKIIGLVPTMCDRRTKLSASLIKRMEKEFGRNLVRPGIRLDTKLAEAPGRGKPIQLYAPNCNGAYDYTILADDLRIM